MEPRDYGPFPYIPITQRPKLTWPGGTQPLNSDLCDHHPQMIEAAVKAGWEFMGHNNTNSVWLDTLGPEAERTVIKTTMARIAAATGKRPVGWLGAGLAETWHTLDY